VNLKKSIVVLMLLVSPMLHANSCNIVNGKAYGNCGNVNVNTKSKGILEVKKAITEPGIIIGAVVYEGGILYLAGICNGNIEIKKGGKVIVSGVVNGTIVNGGGHVDIEGIAQNVLANSGSTIISGTVTQISGSGEIKYVKGAVVSGVPVE
jgi:hypothetical protein